MPIEFDCPSCGRHYKVADSNAGKRFACKECGQPATVPSATPPQVAPPPAVSAPPPAQGYEDDYADDYGDEYEDQGYEEDYGQGYDEQAYGNESYDQGYAAPQPRLPQPRMPGQRGPAGGRGPGGPRRPGPRPPMGRGPGGPRRGGGPRPYGGGRGRGMPMKAHRGTNILIFSLLGWFVCPIFCIVAIVMGGSDLKEMKRGAMDRSGEGLTKAGYWMSWFVVGANAIVLVFVIILMLSSGRLDEDSSDTKYQDRMDEIQRQHEEQRERQRDQFRRPERPAGG